jgi:2-oxoglutarate dehydrogenase E1 component
MSPKSLLRHKQAVSPLDDLVVGRFQEFLEDPLTPENPRRLVLCSGKVYYDLSAGRQERGIDDVAIVRVEQFYPFHTELFERVVAPYQSATEIVWVQEETRNRGGWAFMMPKLMELFPDRAVRYVGREPSASPATGSSSIHRQQQAELVRDALEMSAD